MMPYSGKRYVFVFTPHDDELIVTAKFHTLMAALNLHPFHYESPSYNEFILQTDTLTPELEELCEMEGNDLGGQLGMFDVEASSPGR